MEQMQVEMDGELIPFSPEQSFCEVAGKLKDKLGPGRVLSEIWMNDRAIGLDEEDRIQGIALKELGALKFLSKDVGDLLRESLQLAPHICEALSLDCDDISGFIETKKWVLANSRIAELSSLVDWLLQTVASAQAYGSDEFRERTFEGEGMVSFVKRMESRLIQLHTQLQKKEYEGFRNLLQNDFKPELSRWQQMFGEVSSCWTPRPLCGDS